MFSVKDPEKFKCGFKNCRSSFSSEFLINEHFQMKHDGRKNLIIVMKNSDAVIRTLLEINRKQVEKCAWVSSNDNRKKASDFVLNQTFQMNRKCYRKRKNVKCGTVPIVPRYSFSKGPHIKCLKCGMVVSHYLFSTEPHILYHVSEIIGREDFFKCSLCPKNNVYTCKYRQLMHNHVSRVHHLKDSYYNKNYYLDNRNQFVDVIKSVTLECFGEKQLEYTNKKDRFRTKKRTELELLKGCVKTEPEQTAEEDSQVKIETQEKEHFNSDDKSSSTSIFSKLANIQLCSDVRVIIEKLDLGSWITEKVEEKEDKQTITKIC